jgi:hypothetical protein
MGIQFSNNAVATVTTRPSGVGGLSFSIEAGKGALYPAASVASGNYFYGTFKDATRVEIVKIEARTSDAFTIAAGGRGLDGTTAIAWDSPPATMVFELCTPNIALWDLLKEFKDNFVNTAKTFTSKFVNTNTAARTYTFPDQDGVVVTAESVVAAPSVTTADADVMPVMVSSVLKNVTWANIKATFFTAIGALTAAGTGKAAPADNDVFVIGDSADGNATKKLTYANLKAAVTVPVGTILDFAGAVAQIPSGYIVCNGASLATTGTYANLFAAIGYLWGGSGANFNAPNFPAFYAAVQNNGTVGATTAGVMPAHTHTAPATAEMAAGSNSGALRVGGTGITTSSAGSGTDNLAAGKCVLKIIKY